MTAEALFLSKETTIERILEMLSYRKFQINHLLGDDLHLLLPNGSKIYLDSFITASLDGSNIKFCKTLK